MKRRQLPTGALRGVFLIHESAVAALERLLPTYRDAVDGNHEGIAFLCGREVPQAQTTIYMTAIAPNADHRTGYVRCSEDQMAEVSNAARALGLGVLAQVHTHPGDWTEHSEGDDEMVLLPFDGMLSIVVPCYAKFGLRPLDSLGVHQFQNRQWTLVDRESVRKQLRIVPDAADLR